MLLAAYFVHQIMSLQADLMIPGLSFFFLPVPDASMI
jgi:hypothetical protein